MPISLKDSEGQAFSNAKLFSVSNLLIVFQINILDTELYLNAITGLRFGQVEKLQATAVASS